ncbi:hypothetical protein [Salsipaludibacter albus]|uniref:hypothetical protein n=1 Tax=Salsipaludibacter albus TaxID=2849650 RepID=UPI001EE4BE31|nr:hypothetical protein [Salsipaludibacter albus]MBY5162516.1 hypothetical protein [Salsipaludibacter albus]
MPTRRGGCHRTRHPRGRRIALLVLALAMVLAACGDDRAVAWRDLDVFLPEGWVVINAYEGALYVADGSPGGEAGDPGDQEVGVQFTIEPGTTADDWRTFVEEQDGTLERDEAVTVDDLPATLLEFSFDGSTGPPPTREQIVVVPSRSLVVLSQAVPVQGQQDGPEVFDAHVAEFDALRDSIDFGAPEDYVE